MLIWHSNWSIADKFIYSYDSSNNKLSPLYQYWNSSDQVWDTISKSKYTYDSNNFMNSVTFKYLNANYGTGSDSTHYYFHTTTTSNQGPKTKEKILNIFPNPATTSVAISLSLTKPESISLSLTNSMGQLVHAQNQQLVGEKNKIEIPVSNITSGIYFLSVKGKDWSRFEKVIVERN